MKDDKAAHAAVPNVTDDLRHTGFGRSQWADIRTHKSLEAAHFKDLEEVCTAIGPAVYLSPIELAAVNGFF